MADFLCHPLFYRQEVVSLCRQSVQIMQKIPKPMGINLFEAKPTVETIAKVGNPFEQFGSLVGFEMPPVKGGISKNELAERLQHHSWCEYDFPWIDNCLSEIWYGILDEIEIRFRE